MSKDEDASRVQLATLVRTLRENLLAHIELNQLQAKIIRAKFNALVEQGFTVDQALILVK